MFCKKCGREVQDGSRFCTSCGAIIENEGVFEQIEATPKNSNNKSFVILWLLLISLTLMVGGGFLIWSQSLNRQCNSLMTSIESYQIPMASEKKDTFYKELEEISIFDVEAKQEMIQNLKNLEEEAKEAADELVETETELKGLMDTKEQYNLDESFIDYEAVLDECNAAVQSRDAEKAIDLLEKSNEALKQLVEKNEGYINKQLESYANIDLSIASAEEVSEYNKGIEKLKELSNQKKFNEAKSVMVDVDNVVLQYIEPEKYLNVSVQQLDVTAYPNVKLYTRIEDQNTKNVPENLKDTLFFVRKKDANAYYVKQVVSKVTQLNETESLNIDMVADISGSMDGSPIQEAKMIMSNFIRSVQFDAGDKVELTTFSTGVYIVEEFTNNENILIEKINNLVTGDMTSLYDALYTSVSRVAAQPGAKCVIAFTDGMDNYSNCSSDDVIELAKRYHVPIFIIGIGNYSDYNASNIASQTGGKYYTIYDVNSMEEIYQEIYREQKELFLIEFIDDNTGKISDESDLIVGYNSKEYGGKSNFTYKPNVLLSVTGTSFYKDGPEAVVEGYMNGFDDAMTNRDFSYISDYLKVDSNIYNAQKKYVQRGIEESLVSYEIVDVTYNNNNESIVTTRETYYVQKPGEPLHMMTQQCKYIVVFENNQWKMIDFAGSVEVLSKINQ